MRPIFVGLLVGILLVSSFSILAVKVRAEANGSVPVDVNSPTSCLDWLAGNYTNPQPAVGQIASNGRGAAVCSWSLSSLSGAKHIRLSFEMLTNVPTFGRFGPHITAVLGLATSAPVRIDSDLSAIFPLDTKTTTTTVDCCDIPARLLFESDDDNVFHSYTIDVDLGSNTTTWTADGGAAATSYSGFAFIPTQLFFWAQGHDDRNSMVAQIRNVVLDFGIPQFEVRSISLVPVNPVEGQSFALNMVAQNNGETAISVPRELILSPVTPTLDAAEKSPWASCILSGPLMLQASQQATKSYSCIANWSFVALPNAMETLMDAFQGLAESAAGDIVSYGVLRHAKSVLGPDEFKIFEDGWDAKWGATWGTATVAYDTARNVAGVIDLFRHNGLTLGVTYALSFPTNMGYTVGIDAGPLQATVVAPEHKFDEAMDWVNAKFAAQVASVVLAEASAATIAGCATLIGCLVPGVLLAASVLVGPVTDVYYQDQLGDPSPLFTQFATVSPPPAFLTSLPENTFKQTLLYEYEYASNLNATVESSARGAAAFQALSLYYARLQYDHANYFAENAARYFTLFQSSLNSTVGLISPVNKTDYDAGIQEIKTNGIPQPVQEILGELGLNSFLNVTYLSQISFQEFSFPAVVGSLFNAGATLYNNTLLHKDYVSAPLTSTTTSVVKGGRALLDQTILTGITVNVTGSSAPDETTLNATVMILSQQPDNTGPLKIAPITFFDLRVLGLPDGLASICITSEAITQEITTMQYWNGSSWIEASSLGVSEITLCGTIPIQGLAGTSIAIGVPAEEPTPSLPPSPIFLYAILGVIAVAIAALAVFGVLRRRETEKRSAKQGHAAQPRV